MPIIRSASKRMRQSRVRRNRNRARRSELRSTIRRLDQAIVTGDTEGAQQCWNATQALFDRTARLGIIHRNTAARRKSRLARRMRTTLPT